MHLGILPIVLAQPTSTVVTFTYSSMVRWRQRVRPHRGWPRGGHLPLPRRLLGRPDLNPNPNARSSPLLRAAPCSPHHLERLRRCSPSQPRLPTSPRLADLSSSSAVVDFLVPVHERKPGSTAGSGSSRPLPPRASVTAVVSGHLCAPKLSQAFRSRSVSSSLPPFFSSHCVSLHC